MTRDLPGLYASVTRSRDRWELRSGDEGYPPCLDELPGELGVLYGIGSPSALGGPCISIVGSRRATPYGLACARMAGRVAAECGITVVSGGAMGCDHEASKAALDAGGRTVIVAGTGADVVYPRSSDDIFADAVRRGGCVISLERWGSAPRKYAFPKRNRVIAALSRSLLVCEAGVPSGTFSTAGCASELGRGVYAIPGSIFSPLSRGANWLLESGASIIPDEQALEMRISLDYNRLRLVSEGGGEESLDSLLEALVACPMRPDEVARAFSMDLSQALMTLASHEAAGMVRQLPDGRFAPTEEVLLRRHARL